MTLRPTDAIPLHPNDLMFFHEVSQAMWKVAKKYDLRLRTVTGLHMPESGIVAKEEGQ